MDPVEREIRSNRWRINFFEDNGIFLRSSRDRTVALNNAARGRKYPLAIIRCTAKYGRKFRLLFLENFIIVRASTFDVLTKCPRKKRKENDEQGEWSTGLSF